MASINLLGSLSRVETPFVKVQIGDYTFGVYDKQSASRYESNANLLYAKYKIVYPNYIQNLTVKKINGQVNTYTLNIKYPVTEGSDPNFFEKVFSSVSKSRKIVFSYGDLSVPNFIYKEEEAIITGVKANVSVTTSVLDYVVSAVSSVTLSSSIRRDFSAVYCKPSDRIKWLLQNNTEFGLQDLFYGMRDYSQVLADGLIAGDDWPVQLEYQVNMSALDYLTYLVNAMVSTQDNLDSTQLTAFYSLVIYDDTSGKYDGPYFKVIKVDKVKEHPEAYEIDIGYPSQNVVTDLQFNNDEGYSILYNYANEINPEVSSYRINSKGVLEEIYSPIISSANSRMETKTNDQIWWSKITQFPINITLTLKGLLRPAILMTYVRVNIYFYGQKYAASGLYIITQQQDTIGLGGYRTSLTLLRISGDED